MSFNQVGKAGAFNIYKFLDEDGRYRLFFEHEEYGDEYACQTWHDKLGFIYDVDFCYVIPKEVGEWLCHRGYNVYWDYEHEMWGYSGYAE